MMRIAIDPRNQTNWDIIMSCPAQIEGEVFPPRIADAVQSLWTDAGVQESFGRRNELQLNDSAP